MPALEHRAVPRFQVRIPVQFTTDGRDLVRLGEIADLSEEGMFLHGNTLAPVGTRVAIRVALDGADTVVLRGVVVWVNERGAKGAGMGVQLFATPPTYLRRLVDLVAALRLSGQLRG